MADVVTVTSNALAIAEIRSGILSPLGSECKAVSCASKDFYLSCVDDPSLTLNDFPLTDIEISRHCLPEGAEWPQIRDAIRASRFPRVHTLDLNLASSKMPSGIYFNKTSSKSMMDAFDSFEQIKATFPNLQVVQDVPVDTDRWLFSTVMGTLLIPKTDNGLPSLTIDSETRLGSRHMTSKFPLPDGVELVHDLELPAEYNSSSVTVYENHPPITGSVHLCQESIAEQSPLDYLLPSIGRTLSTAHQRVHNRPIPCMSFDLRLQSSTGRSTEPYSDLATSLRNHGLIGDGGLTELGSLFIDGQGVPTDEACLTDQSLLNLHEGLRHWSVRVSRSKDPGQRSDKGVKSPLALPKSLRELTLQYNHKDFPDQEYVSRIAQLLDDIDPELIVDAQLSCDMADLCEDPHGGGHASILERERRRVRSERIEK